jgi:uncharacterized linocin/CFP29 family protein
MTQVEYTFKLKRTFCDELEEVRRMNKNRDYSGLAAAVERMQAHANAMEAALYRGQSIMDGLKKALEEEKPLKPLKEQVEELIQDAERGKFDW